MRGVSRIRERREKTLWGDQSVRVPHELGDFVPVGFPIETDTNPAARANVWRNEESLGVRPDHDSLVPGRGLAPHRRSATPVVVVGVRVHGEQLVAHPKRRLSPRFDLVGLGKGQADLAEPSEWGRWHHLECTSVAGIGVPVAGQNVAR